MSNKSKSRKVKQRKELENKFKYLEKEYIKSLNQLQSLQDNIMELELDMENNKYKITEDQDQLFAATPYHYDMIEMMLEQIDIAKDDCDEGD